MKSNSILYTAAKVEIKFLLINFFVLLIMLPAQLSAATIQVKTDRNPVSLNESFQLIYESSESVDDDPDFAPLEKYLDILNRSQSSNISIINGSYNSSKTWTLNVIARQEGVIVLPPVFFGSDLSDPYKITVKAAAKIQLAQSGFYTRIRVDQEQIYAQQQLVITQQIFSDKNMSDYGMAEIDFNGMDVIILPLGEGKQFKTRIGDKAYLVIEKSYAVFPQTSGLLKLAPVLAEARIGSSNSFFSLGSGKVVRARSNALDIAVLPVPANINVNPWLPAKEFQLLEQWPQNPPEFVQGEPVTRTLSIKADGLTAAQLPVLPDISIDGLKQYPDQPLLNDVQNDTGISGYRVEKVALIPTVAGTITLPAIDIPWWNTVTQKREVASIPARTINVVPAATVQAPALIPALVVQAVEPDNSVTENIQTPQMDAQSPGSKMWMFVAILFAAAWVVTALSWFLVSSKRKPRGINEETINPSVKQQYKLLKAACDKKQAAEVRMSLVNWARVYFSPTEIHNPHDVMQKVPKDMASEIKKLDAHLYGGHQQDIDFELIADSITQLMKSEPSKSAQKQFDLLEPLYK